MPFSPFEQQAFEHSRRAANAYARQLRSVAANIAKLAEAYDGSEAGAAQVVQSLHKYADLLLPWAQSISWRMITDVARRDERAWEMRAKQMGRALRQEIRNAPTGQTMRLLQQEQVHLITSLPREAADQVQNIVLEALPRGARHEELVARIQQLGPITKNRATLIARTEVSRATTNLTQARAQFVGSTEYIWRTAKDGRVRSDHKRLEGGVFRWDDPPVADRVRGMRAHPGAIYNCRCYPEPIIPND